MRIFSTEEVLAALLNSVSLGGGGFGDVFQCRIDGMEVALKMPRRFADMLNGELVMASYDKLVHPNIVRLLGYGTVDQT